MTKEEFGKLSENFIFLDGATGSNLIKRGMPKGICPEKWILENREVLINLQLEYFEAGTNIVLAPTFGANRIKLAEYGLEADIEEINRSLVKTSLEAKSRFLEKNPNANVFVAVDITMTGRQLKPMGDMEFEELVNVYKEQISYCILENPDMIFVETMTSLQETRAALIAAKEITDIPVLCSLTFENNNLTLFGTDGMTGAGVLESLGASAVGCNCSVGPDKLCVVVKEMSSIANVPLIAKPNAGLPGLDENGDTVYSVGPKEFASDMVKVIEAGATILGGCCGTTPEHIKALVEVANQYKPVCHNRPEDLFYLCSEKRTVTFKTDSPFMIVGERINPTGKKKLQAELKEGSFELVHDYAISQMEDDATFLDVNVGMGGIDELETMLTAIDEVVAHVSLPLVLDSSSIEVMEQALRHYPGRALINSISLEERKFRELLPIAKKYGAMFILLPLSDEGLPKNLDEKKSIIDKILKRALELGIKKNSIIVDGLVTTVGANKEAALETLETIRYCKNELELPTIVGLSNISFGLPERANVNAAFLNLAIESGLTMAILNPSQYSLVLGAYATDMLLNKEAADLRYINYVNKLKEKFPEGFENKAFVPKPSGANGSASEAKNIASPDNDIVKKAVISGNKKAALSNTQFFIEQGKNAKAILDESLLPAINEVGNLFESGKYFLPQLIASAEAMRTAIDYLEPMLKNDVAGKNSATIVIATVKGDIHDIGKNLCALMLKNYGFKVYDLGKDVDSADIIDAAVKYDADIIALSALMTTTMREMETVIKLAKSRNIRAKIMVGGAVITQDYADEICADGYSKDAQEACALAKKIINLCNKR